MRREHFHRAPLTNLGSSPWSRCENHGLIKETLSELDAKGKHNIYEGSVHYLWANVIACANASPDGMGLNGLKVWHCGKKEDICEKDKG